MWIKFITAYNTVKSWLSERPLSETTGVFEDDGWARLFSLLFIAIKLTIFQISIFPKNSIFLRDSSIPIKEMAVKLPFKIRKSELPLIMSRMVIMISLLGRVRFTHPSDLADRFPTCI